MQTSGVDENLASIFFTTPKKGVCVGYHGTVLKTDDGGARWFKVSVPSAYYLTGVCFTSETTGFIVGEFGTVPVKVKVCSVFGKATHAVATQ